MYEFRAAGLRGLLCVLLWLVAVVPLTAHASFPATADPTVCTVAPCVKYQYSGGTYQWTRELACPSAAAGQTAQSGTFNFQNPRLSGTSCLLDRYYKTDGAFFNTATLGVSTLSVSPGSPYICPANSTLSGSNCTCSAGYAQDGNTCVLQQAFDNAACKALADGLNFVGAPMLHYGSAGLTACFAGFVMSGTGAASGGGQTELYGPFKCSGANASACSVLPKPGDITATCAAGTYPGTVNGVQVCVPPTTSVEAPKTTTATPPEGGGPAPEIPGAPAGTTTEEKQTACDGPNCTTTTTYKNSGGVPTGTRTETVPRSSYCTENPKAPICAGETEADCPENATSIGCMKVGTPEDGEIPTQVVNVGNVTPDSMAGFNIGHSCPPDLTIDIFGKTHHFEFKPLCDAAPMIKPIVMLLAAFSALGIVYAALVGNA